MRFGVNLVNFGPGAAPDSLARWGQTAEALGYHFLMVSDHVAVTPDVQARYPAPFYDLFVTLAWLAGRTSKLRLGTTVAVLPYRHPLQVASMSEGIHRLSGGRFVLGVGVGLAEQEYAALGLPFEKRGAMTDDYLAALRALWDAGGDVASHEGPFVSFEDVRTAPDLVGPSGSLPVWVGGSSEAALTGGPCASATAGTPTTRAWSGSSARACRASGRSPARRGRPVLSFCPRVRLSPSRPSTRATRPGRRNARAGPLGPGNPGVPGGRAGAAGHLLRRH